MRITEEQFAELHAKRSTATADKWRQDAPTKVARKPRNNEERRVQEVTFHGEPIGKPRMTRSDKWKKRECVLRYRAFADNLRLAFNRAAKFADAPLCLNWRAFLPIPDSWSKKRKTEMAGKPHRQKPDRDNIDKALMDSLFHDDSGVAFGEMAKFWDDGKGPRIEITLIWGNLE